VMLGVERRSLVLSDDERRLTAYHEGGHAIVSLAIPGLDPLHKVTIVPRGSALGLTSSLPEEDRHNYTKYWLEGRLAMLFGGRVAEELVFGPDKVTTGAASDIERATTLARRMVTQFGMSEKIGAIAVGDKEQEIFLGRELSQRREISERTSETVDEEVKRIIDTAYERAKNILAQQRDRLDRLAAALLEFETLEREEILLVLEGKELPPRAAPVPLDLPPAPPAADKPAARALGVPSEAPSPA
jgi:cell division protease FtsH